MDPKYLVNVWQPTNHETVCDRIAKQARDVEETAARIGRLAAELKQKAQRGDRAAERALAVLCDDSYEAYAVAVLEAKTP